MHLETTAPFQISTFSWGKSTHGDGLVSHDQAIQSDDHRTSGGVTTIRLSACDFCGTFLNLVQKEQ